MKSLKFLTSMAIILVSAGTIHYYRDEWKSLFFPSVSCAEPITYSLGSLDERFNMTEEEFIRNIQQAEAIWEKEIGKELFAYSATGTLKVNLIYDERQKATDALQTAGIAISNDKETYTSLKARYESQTAEFERKKTAYENRIEQFEIKKFAYERDVEYWNKQGGAPPNEYAKLQKEQYELQKEADSIIADKAKLDALADSINSTVTVLNKVAEKINMKVVAFNKIGASTGEEFNEGEYVRDAEGERINVYQFDDKATLLRLLQHELGHALGLEHVKDPDAIMYRLNSSENAALTADDISELRNVCKES